MEKITITIETVNAAFGENEFDKVMEVSRILQYLARNLERESKPVSLRDQNGNKVGTIEYE